MDEKRDKLGRAFNGRGAASGLIYRVVIDAEGSVLEGDEDADILARWVSLRGFIRIIGNFTPLFSSDHFCSSYGVFPSSARMERDHLVSLQALI